MIPWQQSSVWSGTTSHSTRSCRFGLDEDSRPVAATVWATELLIPPLYRNLPFITISESSRSDLIRRGVDAERGVVRLSAVHYTSDDDVDRALAALEEIG